MNSHRIPTYWNSVAIDAKPYVTLLAARVAVARRVGPDATPTKRAFAQRAFAEARNYFVNRKPASP
jgi:hypothetical protein